MPLAASVPLQPSPAVPPEAVQDDAPTADQLKVIVTSIPSTVSDGVSCAVAGPDIEFTTSVDVLFGSSACWIVDALPVGSEVEFHTAASEVKNPNAFCGVGLGGGESGH